MKLVPNDRKMVYYIGVDRYGCEYSFSESSLATEECCWVGSNQLLNRESKPYTPDFGLRAHLTREQALELGEKLVEFGKRGWEMFDDIRDKEL